MGIKGYTWVLRGIRGYTWVLRGNISLCRYRGEKEKMSGTEKRCSHNLQSAHLGQRRICDLTAGLFSEVE